LYGCGDFIDDYAVDENYKNDLSFLFELYLDDETNEWHKIKLFPTKIKSMQVNHVTVPSERDFLFKTMTRLSKEYGTKIINEKSHLTVDVQEYSS